ncbi:MAG: hypothetical protein QOJ65_1443, partial [Fimbriimonadaceae bacterium]|nr:hypothetical protein [Fimbriimonadaceae bacterium]
MKLEPTGHAKGIAQHLLLACPIVFSGFVALYSRGYQDNHVTPTGTQEQDARVLAYAPFVKESKVVFNKGQIDREKLLALATRWDKAASASALKPLVPVSFEDSPEEGGRGEIMLAKSQVVAALLEDSRLLGEAGKADQAANEALLAMRLSESLKYSDFHSVYLAGQEQRKAVSRLHQVAPMLDAEARESVR